MAKHPRIYALARRLLTGIVLVAATLIALPADAADPEPPPPPPPPESSATEEPTSDESESQADSAQEAVDPPKQADDGAPKALMAVGRVFTGGLFGLLAAAGGTLVGGIVGGLSFGGGRNAGYGMLFGASLAVPLGYYAGARLPNGKGSLAGTFLGAVGAYGVAAVSSLADDEAIFTMMPLAFIGSAVGNEISHAFNSDPSRSNAAGPARDTTGVSAPMIGTGPGDIGLSLSFSF